MTKMETIHLTLIQNTSNYGLIKEGSIFYDDQKILKEFLLNFKLYKIRCMTELKVGITGLEIFYKDRITSKEIKTIDIRKKENGDEEQEIVLDSSEMINSITLWKDESLHGFEVKTNKDRMKKFGCCGEGNKIELDEFEEGNNYLCGFFCGFHKKDGLTSIGFYYLNKREFYLLLYFGILCLKIKLKKEDFKKKIMEKLCSMDYSDKALFQACSLPDNQFFGIFKYIFH